MNPLESIHFHTIQPMRPPSLQWLPYAPVYHPNFIDPQRGTPKLILKQKVEKTTPTPSLRTLY